MDKIIETLESLGLSDKETLTYVTLLKTGKSTVGKISENCGLKRPTLYLILEELRKKGFVLKIPHSKKQVFIAKSVDDFLYEQKQKIKRLESLSPLIKSFSKKTDSSKVLLFEGVEGMKEAADYKIDELRDTEFLGFYSHVSESYTKESLSLIKEGLEKHKKLNIKRRGFIPNHDSLEEYISGKYLIEVKPISFKKYNSEISIEIRGDFILASSVKDMQFLIIDNPNIAKTLRQVFNLMWENID